MSSTKKKRRRSSLAPTRIRVDMAPDAGKDLHKQIDDSLAPQKRLEELSRLAIKYAVDKGSQNTEQEETKEYFRDALHDLQKVVDSGEFQEAIRSACKPDSVLSSSSTEEIDETIKIMENRITRLKREQQEWNDYIAELGTTAENAKQQVEKTNLHASDLTPRQVTLSEEYLPSLPDAAAVRDLVDKAKKQFYILVCEHENNVNHLSQLHRRTNKKIDTLIGHLDGRMIEKIQSPKASVERLLEFPTPPGHK